MQTKNILLVAGVVIAAAAILVLKTKQAPLQPETHPVAATATPSQTLAPSPTPAAPATATAAKKLPRLIDLGADKCIPCRMMAPILEELKEVYADKISVEFIDVWKNPDAAQRYGVRVIPTQIFIDAEGRELFRHEGFFGKDDILAKWKELGVDLIATSP